jgi:hypothetical protein
MMTFLKKFFTQKEEDDLNKDGKVHWSAGQQECVGQQVESQ